MKTATSILALVGGVIISSWTYQVQDTFPTLPTNTSHHSAPNYQEDPLAPFRYWQEIRQNPDTKQVHPKDIAKAKAQADALSQQKDICNQPSITPLTWESIGPKNGGGRTRTIVIDKEDNTRIYTGGTAGGFWFSTNSGTSWQPSPYNEQLENLAISSIAQAEDGVLYVGTGEAIPERAAGDDIAFSFLPGGGIYRSFDKGLTFELLPATKPHYLGSQPFASDWAAVNKLAAHPTNPNLIYAATNNGLWMTKDKGEHWDKPHGLLGNLGSGDDVEVDANGKVYAVIGGRIYAAVDGENFQVISNMNGLPSISRRGQIAVAPSDPNYVYVVNIRTSGCMDVVYQSKDGGQNWAAIGEGDGEYLGQGFLNPCSTYCQCWYSLALAVDPLDREKIWLGGVALYSWSAVLGWNAIDNSFKDPANLYYVPKDKHDIVFDPINSNTVYIASDGGISKSTTATLLQPTFQLTNKNYNVVKTFGIATGHDGSILAGTQGTGLFYIDKNAGQSAQIGSYSSTTSLSSWYTTIGFAEISNIIQTNPSTGEPIPPAMFITPPYEPILRSTDGGQWFASLYSPYDDLGDSEPYINKFFLWEDVDRYYNGDGQIDSKLFTGGTDRRIWMTKEALNPSKMPDDWQAIGRFSGNNTDQFLSSVAVTPDGATVFAVSTRGRMLRISQLNDAASISEDIASEAFLGRYLTGVAINPNNSNQVVVVAGNYGRSDYVFVTNNALAEADFVSIQGDLPEMPVYDVVMTHNPEHAIIIGTELGIWSYNSTLECWQEQNEGMGRVPVFRLRLETVTDVGCQGLYVGTHGRGFFVNQSFMGHCSLIDYEEFDVVGITSPTNMGKHSFTIFPNPIEASTTITVTLSSAIAATLELYDIVGRKIQAFEVNKTTDKQVFRIQKNNLKQGLYIVKLTTLTGSTSKKLVVR